MLVDGARRCRRIAEALQGARRFVHVTGWHLAPHFELVRGEPAVALGALLAELAERIDVRVLVWAGAPVPAFHPTRKEVREAVEHAHARARASAASPTRASTRSTATTRRRSCIDGEVAFVNGIDMTDDGRRPLRLHRASGPPAAGLARRRHAAARARGGRRARPLRDALARA